MMYGLDVIYLKWLLQPIKSLKWYIPSFPNVMLELDDYKQNLPEVSTAYNLNNSII